MKSCLAITLFLLTSLAGTSLVAQSIRPLALDLSVKGRDATITWDPERLPLGNPRPRSLILEVVLDGEVLQSASISSSEDKYTYELTGNLSCKNMELTIGIFNLNGDKVGEADKKVSFPCSPNVTALIPGWNHLATTGYKLEGAGILIGSLGLAAWSVFEYNELKEIQQSPLILATAGTQLIPTAATAQEYADVRSEYQSIRNRFYISLGANVLVYGARFLWEGPFAKTKKRAIEDKDELMTSQWKANRRYRSLIPQVGFVPGAYSFGFNYTF